MIKKKFDKIEGTCRIHPFSIFNFRSKMQEEISYRIAKLKFLQRVECACFEKIRAAVIVNRAYAYRESEIFLRVKNTWTEFRKSSNAVGEYLTNPRSSSFIRKGIIPRLYSPPLLFYYLYIVTQSLTPYPSQRNQTIITSQRCSKTITLL